MILGTVTAEGQITIPIKELGKFKAKPGARVSFEAVGNEIVCKEVEDEELNYDDLTEEESLFLLKQFCTPEWTSGEDDVYDDL